MGLVVHPSKAYSSVQQAEQYLSNHCIPICPNAFRCAHWWLTYKSHYATGRIGQSVVLGYCTRALQ